MIIPMRLFLGELPAAEGPLPGRTAAAAGNFWQSRFDAVYARPGEPPPVI